MTFAGRSRQPPEDVINAALSYGYAIILSEAVSALCAAGLDPAIGLLHAEQDRRPSLALDLMEEFRPLIVDQVVIAAARRAELRPEHGHREESVHGVLLTKAGREILLAGYERRMLQHTKGALPGLSGSLRRHLYRQAERLAALHLRPGRYLDRPVMALTHVIAYDISDDHRRAREPLSCKPTATASSAACSSPPSTRPAHAKPAPGSARSSIPAPTRSTSSGNARHAGTRLASTARRPSPAKRCTGQCCRGGW